MSGKYEVKELSEMLPSVLPQLVKGTSDFEALKKLAQSLQPEGAKAAADGAADDDVPQLVGNFEDASKKTEAQ